MNLEHSDDRLIYDWIEYTIFPPSSAGNFYSLDKIPNIEFNLLPKGKYGYKSFYLDDVHGIQYLCDGNDGMGVHVILSGQSCRNIESVISCYDFLIHIINLGAKITRLDIACDLFNRPWLNDFFTSKYEKEEYVSKSKKTKIIKSKHKNRESFTIYFGSRSSKVMIRIYDKSAEKNLSYEWIRIEIVIKDDYIPKVINNIKTFGINNTFSGILNNYLRFIDLTDSQNKSRCKTNDKWIHLIQNLSKIKLYSAPPESTVESLKEWVYSQVSSTLWTIAEAELSTNFIDDILKIGAIKAKTKHYKMIDDYRRMKN